MYVWCYLFVELLQLYLNTVLITLLDALDNPLHVYVHASCTHTNTHRHQHNGIIIQAITKLKLHNNNDEVGGKRG